MWSADRLPHATCDWRYNDSNFCPTKIESLESNLCKLFSALFLWHAQNTTWLTKLLNGPVCTPRQFQCHMDSPPLVLHPLVCLEGDPRAGSLWDNGHQLEMKEVYIYGVTMSINLWNVQWHKQFCQWQMFIFTFSPPMKRSFSFKLMWSMVRPCSARDSYRTLPSGRRTTRPLRPVICTGNKHY